MLVPSQVCGIFEEPWRAYRITTAHRFENVSVPQPRLPSYDLKMAPILSTIWKSGINQVCAWPETEREHESGPNKPFSPSPPQSPLRSENSLFVLIRFPLGALLLLMMMMRATAFTWPPPAALSSSSVSFSPSFSAPIFSGAAQLSRTQKVLMMYYGEGDERREVGRSVGRGRGRGRC